MGSISGRKLYSILDNLEYILSIELMSACQAIEFRRPLKSSAILEFAHGFVRQFVGFAKEDRIFAEDIKQMKKIVADYSFVEQINTFAKSAGVVLNQGFENFVLTSD
jgi:histidine ammonia-lyase